MICKRNLFLRGCLCAGTPALLVKRLRCAAEDSHSKIEAEKTFNPIIPSFDSGVPKGGHGWVLEARRPIGSNSERSAISANLRFATTSASRAQI